MSDEFFNEDHRMFRESVRKFVEAEVTPHHEQWEKDGMVSREVWRKAGENGLLCMEVPEEYGGLGLDGLQVQHDPHGGARPWACVGAGLFACRTTSCCPTS
jgi:alkylation response protein AidB-like acyl-CoA dehydrogenase